MECNLLSGSHREQGMSADVYQDYIHLSILMLRKNLCRSRIKKKRIQYKAQSKQETTRASKTPFLNGQLRVIRSLKLRMSWKFVTQTKLLSTG